MTRSLPRWVHRNLPRAAPPDSWRSLRSARVPPMHYLDKLPRRRLGAGKTVWVRIKSANQPKVGQNSPGVDSVFPGGITSFSMIQAASDAGNAAGLVYFIFDLLHLDGEDISPLPLIERKARLPELLSGAAPPLHYSDYHRGEGTSPPGKYPQLINAPGSETGPGPQLVTWGKSTILSVDAHGFKFEYTLNWAKHIPFDWVGP